MGPNEVKLRELCYERGFEVVVKPKRASKPWCPDEFRHQTLAVSCPKGMCRAVVKLAAHPCLGVSVDKTGGEWWEGWGLSVFLEYEMSPVWLREELCRKSLEFIAEGRDVLWMRQRKQLSGL